MKNNEFEEIEISYSFARSPFGEILLASTAKGLCYMAFVMKDEADSLKDLQRRFPKASFKQKRDAIQKNALEIFRKGKKLSEIKLHLKGTEFQIKVWKALLQIPAGKLSTYGKIAATIKKPKAFRAVGAAVGQNPISFIVPCHRVVPSSGGFGNYHWGAERKQKMIERERAK